MKRLILTLIAGMLILSSCNKIKQFTVTLTLENSDGQTIYLCKDFGMIEKCIDSAVFKGNNAIVKADFDDPQILYIIKLNQFDQCGVFTFFPENHDITITGDYNDFLTWKATGSPAMETLNAFSEEMRPYEDAVMALVPEMEAAYMEGDTVRGHDLYWRAMALFDEYNNHYLDYIRNHPDSYISHYLLDDKKESVDPELVEDVLSNLKNESVYKKNVERYLKTQHQPENRQ